MKEASQYLVGEHDFKSFCSIHTSAETTVRTIYGIEVKQEGDLILIRVTGSGFLYHMVRIIAGTLILAGNGQIAPEHVQEILKKKDRSAAGPTAPALGLTMIGIEMEDIF